MLFSVYTLGCKLNQLETEAITDSFRREGFSPMRIFSSENDNAQNYGQASAGPSVIVVNTCTVTSMADQKARRIIRKALKDYPASCIIVTGCYAQLEGASLSSLDAERLFVVSGEIKDCLLDLPRFLKEAGIDGEKAITLKALSGIISSWLDSLSGESLSSSVPQCQSETPFKEIPERAFRFKPENFSSHSRSFIKIQDGCDSSCTYCRVSLARGRSRSLGASDILDELISLERRGFSEAVLTGVNISQYRDLKLEATGLPALLEFILRGTSTIRLRLSSIEGDGLTEEFFRVLENPRIRPHFHLSLQSLSASILEGMGRTYTAEDVKKAIAQIRSVRRDPFLACDIIAAFPGETEKDFEETFLFCREAGFAWIHAFPFSPRPGTAAFDLGGRVNAKTAVTRVGKLSDLARKGRRDYISRWEGKEVEAIVESSKNKASSCQKGPNREESSASVPAVSENYLRLLVNCTDNSIPAPGSLVQCRILRAADSMVDNTAGGRFDALAERIG